jgi:hypothetical protein
MLLLRGALFLGGPSAASQTAFEHRFVRLPCGFSANNVQSLTDDPGTIGINLLAASTQNHGRRELVDGGGFEPP